MGIIIILLFITMLYNYDNTMNIIYSSLYTWFYKVFPSLFLLYIIAYYLINNKHFNKLAKILKIFISFENIKSYSIFLVSILLGNPGSLSLSYIEYNKNHISKNDFKKLCYFTIFFNPLFVVSFMGFKFYILYFISTFLIIFIFEKLFKLHFTNSKFVYNAYTFTYFSDSINNIISIVLSVACLSCFFNVFKEAISFLFINLNIKMDFLLQFIEISSGLQYFKNTNNYILCCLLISFQGLCILIQSLNIIKNNDISIIKYIIIRIILSLFVTLLFTIFVYGCFRSSSNVFFN